MNGLLLGLLLPLAGTTLGAGCVFLMRRTLSARLEKTMLGFAGGIMTAASVWSLLIPSMEMTGSDGLYRVVPAVAGFVVGVLFLLLLDVTIPHQHVESDKAEGLPSQLSRTSRLTMAVTIHNIPEGMAVGVALAAVLEHSVYIPLSAALALSAGIAIQNFPEGAIVSMPMRAMGNSRMRAFIVGTLSGVVEPIAAILTILLATLITPILPYLLAFAAGAMIYVVVEELVPATQTGPHSNLGTLGFAAGFALMMFLDTVL